MKKSVNFDTLDDLWGAVKTYAANSSGDLVYYKDEDYNREMYDADDVRFLKWHDWYEGEGVYINRGKHEIPIHVYSPGDSTFEYADLIFHLSTKEEPGVCPFCGSEDYDGIDVKFFDNENAYISCCNVCHKYFADWYEITYKETTKW